MLLLLTFVKMYCDNILIYSDNIIFSDNMILDKIPSYVVLVSLLNYSKYVID